MTPPNRNSAENYNHQVGNHENTIRDYETGKEVTVTSSTMHHIETVELPKVEKNLMNLRRTISNQQKESNYQEFKSRKKTGREVIGYDVELFEKVSFLESREESLLEMIKRFHEIKGNLNSATHDATQEIAVILNAARLAGTNTTNQSTSVASTPKLASAKAETLQGQEFDIPVELLGQDSIMKFLKEHGIVRGDKVILENSDVIEKFNKYKNLFNVVFDIERNPQTQEILDKQSIKDSYVFLINEASKWISEDLREMLTYRLAESIYNDVVRMGAIIERNGVTGEYTIKDIKTDKAKTDNPYFELIQDANTRNLIDVARITSMIDKNFVLNDHELVGDSGLVKHLLEEHQITDKSGKRIVKAEHMLLNKESVLGQINNKLKKVREGVSTSYQAYQELTFLKEYLTSGELQRIGYMRSTLKEVNHYKDFTADKALIGGWEEKDLENLSDKDAAEMVADALQSNRPLIALFGLLALLSKQKKTAFIAFTAAIFATPAAELIRGTNKKVKGVITDDMLDLVQLSDIKYQLDNSNNQTKYEALAKINKKYSEDQYDKNHVELPYLDNKILFDITNAITEKNVDIKMEDNTNNLVIDLQLLLVAKGITFSDADIKTYIKIVKASGIKENGDKTLLDYLSNDQDIANTDYATVNFTGVDEFNEALNKSFRDAYAGTEDDREARKDLLEVRDKVKNIIKKGFVIGEDITKDIDNKIADIGVLLGEEYPAIKDEIIGTLNTSKIYFEAEKDLKPYKGFLDERKELTKLALADIFGVATDTNTTWRAEVSTKINEDIKKLEEIKTDIVAPYKTQEPFISLIKDIGRLILKLKEIKKDIGRDIAGKSRILSSTRTLDVFTTGTAEDIAKDLKVPLTNDLKKLESFVTKMATKELDATKIKDIADEYERLLAYSNALRTSTSATVGTPTTVGFPAISADTTIASLQNNIISTINKFSDRHGVKEEVEEIITKNLDDAFTDISDIKTKVDGINTSDMSVLSATKISIDEIESFFTDFSVKNTDPDVLKIVDKENEATLKAARGLLGETTIIGSKTIKQLIDANISVGDIEDSFKIKKMALEATVDTHIDNIDAISMGTVGEINTAVDQIKEINTIFSGKGQLKMTELDARFLEIAKISDSPNIQTAIVNDLVNIRQKQQDITNGTHTGVLLAIPSNNEEHELLTELDLIIDGYRSLNTTVKDLKDALNRDFMFQGAVVSIPQKLTQYGINLSLLTVDII